MSTQRAGGHLAIHDGFFLLFWFFHGSVLPERDVVDGFELFDEFADTHRSGLLHRRDVGDFSIAAGAFELVAELVA